MEFKETVTRRRMVRNFANKPVPAAIVDRVLDMARHGPSAGFTQGQDFIVVRKAETKKRLAELCGEEEYQQAGFDPFVSTAPVLVVACTNEAAYHRRYQEPDKLDEEGSEIEWPVPYWFFDGGAAVMLLLLAVVDEGLAAGFAGFHDLQRARDTLEIPDEVTPLGVVPIGYPAPDKRSPSLKRGRRSLEGIVHRELW
jgi:nitroreductase